jgi:pyruvate dehydrogenase E2 component (dihydrolipoamide acetyltransferase)
MQNINSSIPQVTQFDQVDITDLEKFRKELFATSKGAVKLSVLPFIIKSCAYALRKYPQVNSAVDMPNNSIVYKKYINIGVAVDTEAGLVVPVVKSVLDKTIVEIAQEVSELASLAHKGALKPNQMQGGCFTVSSLGGIGGTFFTPIVNAPEVAILGVGKATKQPQFDLNGDLFEGLSMPLSLSYDHRAINGGDGARFITHIKNLLADIRSMSLE